MSADNGYILRKNDEGKFVLQMYFASDEEYPAIDSPRGQTFDTLEDAVRGYEKLQDAMVIEYGLTVRVGEK